MSYLLKNSETYRLYGSEILALHGHTEAAYPEESDEVRRSLKNLLQGDRILCEDVDELCDLVEREKPEIVSAVRQLQSQIQAHLGLAQMQDLPENLTQDDVNRLLGIVHYYAKEPRIRLKALKVLTGKRVTQPDPRKTKTQVGLLIDILKKDVNSLGAAEIAYALAALLRLRADKCPHAIFMRLNVVAPEMSSSQAAVSLDSLLRLQAKQCPGNLLERIKIAAQERELNATEVATSLHALPRLNEEKCPAELLSCAEELAGSMSANVVAMSLAGMAKLGVDKCPQALFARAVECAPQMDAHRIQTVFYALPKLGVTECPETIFSRLCQPGLIRAMKKQLIKAYPRLLEDIAKFSNMPELIAQQQRRAQDPDVISFLSECNHALSFPS